MHPLVGLVSCRKEFARSNPKAGRFIALIFRTIFVIWASPVYAQKSSDTIGPALAKVVWSHEIEPVEGLSRPVLIGLPACSEGRIFVLSVDDMSTANYVLKSIGSDGGEVSYRPHWVSGFTDIGPPTRFFAGPTYVAELSSGRRLNRSVNAADEADAAQPLVLLFERDGTFTAGFPLPADWNVAAIGVFPATGHVLVISTRGEEKRGRVSVFNRQGDELTTLDLWDNDPNQSSKKPALALEDGALQFAQIATAGDNLLLVPTLSSAPILWLNEKGVLRTTQVKLPPESALDAVVDAAGFPWLVRTFAHSQRDPPVTLPGPLLEVNPYDGSVERVIQSDEKKYKIVCAHGGTLLGLTTDPKTSSLEVLTGSVPR